MIIGASVLSVPIAFTEEAWNLSKTIPILYLGVILLLTLCFIALYAFKGIIRGHIKERKATFVKRVPMGYSITLLVVIIVMFAINKLAVSTDQLIAAKRVTIISIPASIGAIVVDSFDKEWHSLKLS